MMWRFKWLHRWQLFPVTGTPSVALETPSICFLRPAARSLPRWTHDTPPWLGTQHAGAREVISTSLLSSSSLRLHLRVGDACFLSWTLGRVGAHSKPRSHCSHLSAHRHYLCSVLPGSSWEQSLLSQNSRSHKDTREKTVRFKRTVSEIKGLSSNLIYTLTSWVTLTKLLSLSNT